MNPKVVGNAKLAKHEAGTSDPSYGWSGSLQTGRQPNRNGSGTPSRIVADSGRWVLILSLYSTLCGRVALAGTSACHELPMRAIVDGHSLQPRGDRLKALGYSDLTAQQAEEVDRLYWQLMRNSVRESQQHS